MKSLFCYTMGVLAFPFAQTNAKEKPNVLFIIVDDLRPELNCYGTDRARTPHIDKLAEQGTLFHRAYCQQAISAASRNSFLTGYRPDGIGIYDLKTFFRKNVPDVVTLPQHFKNNGYRVETIGKVFHYHHGNQDDSLSWSVPKWQADEVLGEVPKMKDGEVVIVDGKARMKSKILPAYAWPFDEELMPDARNVLIATNRIKALKDSAFFFAVGITRPHLPFIAPKKYWDLYHSDEIDVPVRKDPEAMVEESMTDFGELRKYYGIPATGYLDDETTRELIRGYLASVSFVDTQIGRLMKALEENNLKDNTIVVLLGDHGWKLGEYGRWCKHSNQEFDANAPLIIAAPDCNKNQQTYSLVEFVDVYPTLCELASLSQPGHLQGQSLAPILKDPSTEIKKGSISQYPRNSLMGYSIRTDQYRYTRWIDKKTKEVSGRELYIQHRDNKPVDKNLAVDPAYKGIVNELDCLLTEELSKYPVYQKKAKGKK